MAASTSRVSQCEIESLAERRAALHEGRVDGDDTKGREVRQGPQRLLRGQRLGQLARDGYVQLAGSSDPLPALPPA